MTIKLAENGRIQLPADLRSRFNTNTGNGFVIAEATSKTIPPKKTILAFIMKGIICFCLVLLIGQGVAYPAPVRIGHGLIGNLNPHETGAIVLGSYFDPDQGTYNNYWSSECRIFDLWRFMPPRFSYINKFKNIDRMNWHEWYRY